MKNLLIILWHYLGQYAKRRLAFKAEFLIASFTSILATIAGYVFVLVLFTRIPHLQGWKFEEILFIYGFSLIPMGLFNIISLSLYEFGDAYIVEGKFDRVLLRPLHSLFQVLFENFRLESLQEIIIGMAAVGYCSVKLGIPWDLTNLIEFPLLVFCGAVIYIFVFVILSSVNFWFEDRIGIAPPVYNMIAFGRYPITIYNAFIQFLLHWIIPFAVASFYPYVGLTHTIRKKGEGWAIRISDHCRHAPGAVLEAIAVLLACKVLRRRAPRDMEEIYEQFRRDPELEAGLRRRRLQRGRKLINSSKGRHHALREIFEELNGKHFNHQLHIKQLGWGPRRSWSRLGHFDEVHNSITISPVLDSPRVPRGVVSYILYHEMLHILFSGTDGHGRGRHHPPEFRRAEGAYPDRASIKKFLNEFCRSRGKVRSS